MRIALVYENSAGLRHDVRVLCAAFEGIPGLRFEFVNFCLNWSETIYRAEAVARMPGLTAPFDVVIFLEITNDHSAFMTAKRKVLIPNPECLGSESLDVVRHLDMIWHKTYFSMSLLEPLFPEVQHRFLGFTSEPLNVKTNMNNQFLHIKGAGGTRRNTDAIIRCWLSNPELPRLTILSHESFPAVARRLPGNLRVREGWIRQDEFKRLYGDHGIHLCTSECEGFGHYINEARAAGALVVATNAPPMNELVSSRSGVLVEAEPGKPLNYGMVYRVTEAAVFRAVHSALVLTATERSRMVTYAQCLYWRDHHRFLGRLMAAVADWFG